MLCPVSCLPLLRELPQWPCLLSRPQCRAGDSWPTTSTQVTEVTEVMPPVCPDEPPSWRRATDSQHHPDQKEVSQPQPCTCPCPYGLSCQWKGILGSVVSHLIQAHQPITDQEGDEATFLISNINLADRVDWVMLQSCFEQRFVLVVKKEAVVPCGPPSFFAAMLLVGGSEEAEGFIYRLELRGSRRRLMWEATPRVVQHGLSDSDCMVFDSALANLFADSGTLGIHVTISRARPVTDLTSHTQELPSHRHWTGRENPTSLMQGSPNPKDTYM